MTSVKAISSYELDQHVKGSSPPSLPKPPLIPSNPLDSAPSSPSQIYLNLLILETSLRSQYLNLLARRRKFTFFLVVLFMWMSFFLYRFFVLGGSPYYYISHLEKLGLGGSVVTGALYYTTGLYHKTIVEPRRFVSVANRGLRGFNVKLVKIPLSAWEWLSWWWGWYTFRPRMLKLPATPAPRRRLSSTIKRPIQPLTSTSSAARSHSIASPLAHEQAEEEEEVEEYLPGGLHIKLVILPKGFSPDFREGWEIYRTEYWERENEARKIRLAKRGIPVAEPPQEKRLRRLSRSGSISSHRGRTPTPEPEALPPDRKRKGSTASIKRRSLISLSKAGLPGDISDSGSTTSVIGEMDRMRRSESVRTDRSSSSTGSTMMEPTRSSTGRGRGRIRTTKGSSLQIEGAEAGPYM